MPAASSCRRRDELRLSIEIKSTLANAGYQVNKGGETSVWIFVPFSFITLGS